MRVISYNESIIETTEHSTTPTTVVISSLSYYQVQDFPQVHQVQQVVVSSGGSSGGGY